MSNNYVFAEDLGQDFLLDVGLQKIITNIDGVTIVRDGTGKLMVDVTALAIGPSTDAGNLLTAGTDGRIFIDAEAVQDAIGQAIAAGAGIEYDDAMNAFKVAMGNMVANDTDSIDLTLDMTTDPSVPALIGTVKIDATTVGNLLKLVAGQGLAVSPADVWALIEPAITFTSAADNSAPATPVLKSTLTVNGIDKVADVALEPVNNAFGAFQGKFTIKA
jgi:hypothetical protein